MYKRNYWILYKQIFESKDAITVDVCISQRNLQILKNGPLSWIGHLGKHYEFLVNVLEGVMWEKRP